MEDDIYYLFRFVYGIRIHFRIQLADVERQANQDDPEDCIENGKFCNMYLQPV